MTVGELTSLLHYSTATINRDLNTLEEQRAVIRNYGGVRLAEPMLMPFSERAVFMADKFFFSTTGVSADWRILTSFNVYRPLITTMMRNSKKSFYLCDFGKLAGVVSDIDFDEEFMARFPDTEFIFAAE